MPHEFEHAPDPTPIARTDVRPPDKAVKNAEIWGTIVDCLVLGFFVAVGVLVALCILRVAYSAYLAVLRWRDFEDCDSSSDDEEYDIEVQEPPSPLSPQQQQAKWISNTGITIVIHPGDVASLAIPSDSKPILQDQFCTESQHVRDEDQIHTR